MIFPEKGQSTTLYRRQTPRGDAGECQEGYRGEAAVRLSRRFDARGTLAVSTRAGIIDPAAGRLTLCSTRPFVVAAAGAGALSQLSADSGIGPVVVASAVMMPTAGFLSARFGTRPDDETVLNLAQSLELVHTASLVHGVTGS